VIGRTVSHYKILEETGAGGMGVVYKAEDTKLKRIVALKFIPLELTRDEIAKKRLLHEARAISTLQHHNICTIHEIDETVDGRTFICMDYYEGETLKSRIAHGPLSVEEAIDITAQIARGLEEAHRRGIIHRDIKPANVMVTTQGVAKVLDFGLAKLAGQTKVTKTGSTVGTVEYMSPEQVKGEELDARSDIFSLGVTLYELLTGKTPFAAEYEPAIMHKILHVAPPSLRNSGVERGAQLDPLLGKMLAKEANERCRSAREVVDALSRIYNQGDRRQTRSAKPRSPRLVFFGGTAALLMAAAALMIWRPWQKPPTPTATTQVRTAIAVLPFQNLSAEESNAFFAGGLHDEILTQLSKVAALKVISRTSVMSYAETKTPLREIARELGVGSVVEGSVQVIGGRLRVNVQLIDAATDDHLWAERYDRTLDDAFAIQSDVAQQIVAAVGARLGRSEQELIAQAPTANAEAYQFYLQALDYVRRPGFLREDYESAQRLYEHAVALDPSFALAHAELSMVHGSMHWFRYDPSAARLTAQLKEAQEALRLAPQLPQAHFAMGRCHTIGERDYQRALDEYEIALRGLPNDGRLWSFIGSIHRRMGNWEKAYAVYAEATRLDPRDASLHLDLGGWTFRVSKRYPEAIRAFDSALTLAPDLHYAAVWKGWTLVQWHGEMDSLRAVLQRLPLDISFGDEGTTRAHLARLLLLERRGDRLLALVANAPTNVFEGTEFYYPTTLYEAWAHQLAGSQKAARVKFEAALTQLDSVNTELSDDYRIHAARGLSLAGLGRREEALDEAEWIAQSFVYRNDAFEGPLLAEERARILAQAGATDAALVEIKRLLTGPSFLSVHMLRLDPLWDPIRNHPRFQALIAKYSEP
jgi:serine/threonine protein kinase/tetratricopeptide (TPR) repeat protein